MASCSFFGQDKMTDEEKEDIKNRLRQNILKLIYENDVSEFWFAPYSDFDHLAAEVVKELKEEFGSLVMVLSLPHISQERKKHVQDKYGGSLDYIDYAEPAPEDTPPHLLLLQSYELMIKRTDFLMSYSRIGFIQPETFYKAYNPNIKLIRI